MADENNLAKKAVLEEAYTYYNEAVKAGFDEDFAKELTLEFHQFLMSQATRQEASKQIENHITELFAMFEDNIQ